ncbi:MAG: GNAT family N-acetyltransferase [Muricauda sp.]|nr:GNAT family N-acetyltransferase [Allomuricauda sp.]
MNLELKRLTDVPKQEIINLMNLDLVRRQMPLLKGYFGEGECGKFLAAKERLWSEFGYGPWAFVINGSFAGWGGLQPENGEADLAMVLHPDYWGFGKKIYGEIIDRAFGEMGMQSVTILLPLTRTRVKALDRLGFKAEGNLEMHGESFVRYRLERPI